MIRTGLCSVAFRDKPIEEIIRLVREARLDGIEWGGDVHVPPTLALARIREIRARTEEAGLTIASYGSYYRVANDQKPRPYSFEQVMDAAEALGTRVIRIWCGGGDSVKASDATFVTMAQQAAQLADAAAARTLTLAFEFHQGSLTDTVASTQRLLRLANRPNLKSYYQINDPGQTAQAPEEVRRLLPDLAYVHCTHYDKQGLLPLAEGRSCWTQIVTVLRQADYRGFVLLEFVKANAAESFVADAATLRELVSAAT